MRAHALHTKKRHGEKLQKNSSMNCEIPKCEDTDPALSGTHIWLDLNQCEVQFMVDVFDRGFILGPALEFYLDLLLVGEDVGIGDNEPILRHYESGAAGGRDFLVGERRPVREEDSSVSRGAGKSGSPVFVCESQEASHLSAIFPGVFSCIYSCLTHFHVLCELPGARPGYLFWTHLRSGCRPLFPPSDQCGNLMRTGQTWC